MIKMAFAYILAKFMIFMFWVGVAALIFAILFAWEIRKGHKAKSKHVSTQKEARNSLSLQYDVKDKKTGKVFSPVKPIQYFREK